MANVLASIKATWPARRRSEFGVKGLRNKVQPCHCRLVTLGKSLNLSEPQFPPFQTWGDKLFASLVSQNYVCEGIGLKEIQTL